MYGETGGGPTWRETRNFFHQQVNKRTFGRALTLFPFGFGPFWWVSRRVVMFFLKNNLNFAYVMKEEMKHQQEFVFPRYQMLLQSL